MNRFSFNYNSFQLYQQYFKIAMPVIEINKYTENHNQEVVDLILNIQQHEFSIPIDLKAQPDLNNIPDFYQTGNGNFWIAMVDNTIAGTIALLDIGNRNVALRKMFVKSEYRGKDPGVAQLLLNKVFEWAIEKKLSSILLGTTEKFLAAHRFYEKNGFTEINKQSLPKEFPLMSVDSKFYKFNLQ